MRAEVAGRASPDLSTDDLLGAWHLRSWENRLDDGRVVHPLGGGEAGYLIYAPHERMAVQITGTPQRAFASPDQSRATVEEALRSFRSSLSYAGRFSVLGNCVRHHVEICAFPNWVGTTLERLARLEGDRLTLTTRPPTPFAGGAGVGVLVWERCR